MSDSLKDAPVHTTTPCNECKHHLGDWVCAAFPPTYKGQVLTVPEDIQDGFNQHRKKHPKQKNDIVFEPIEK